MQQRTLATLIATAFLLIIFFNLKPYRYWLDSRILSFTTEIPEQIDNLDLEYRRETRYGNGYVMAKEILKLTSTLHYKNPIILLPRQNYVEAKGIPQLVMPEPIVLYLFSRLQGVVPGEKDVYKANMGLKIIKGQLELVELHSKNDIDNLLKDYANPQPDNLLKNTRS
ncbi:MAG: hypothetical protein BGO70_06180 [Bacteroidetes bacterium 43-93]|nr:hypothetical protein [Bacteroidota bacterium]OJW97377.1 MAG: hypothetical protein BGO70_06180 [Bacteroidetes bacterium 43-93]